MRLFGELWRIPRVEPLTNVIPDRCLEVGELILGVKSAELARNQPSVPRFPESVLCLGLKLPEPS